MRLNSRGDILAGLGKAWLTDDLSIQQVGSDAQGWKTVNSHGEVLDEQGFNTVCAGGGKWATWLNGRGPNGNFGDLDPAGIVLDIGRDGTVAWCPSYQAGMRVEGTFALSTRVCGPDHLVYTLANGKIWSNRFGYATTPAGVVPFRAVVVGGALLYHTHEWLVLQQYHAPVGIVLASKPAYSPDMIALDGGWSVAWCLNEGETITMQRVVSFDAPLTDLSALRDFPVVPPVPTRSDRFWFGPNIGAMDTVRVFDDPAVLKDVGVFSLYAQNILNLGASIGPNTYEALVANNVFKKLKQAGIPLSIEMGTNLPDLDAIAKVTAAGGDIPIISMNEPLTDAKIHRPMPTAQKLAEVIVFIQRARALGVPEVVWIEAWPEIPLQQQRDFLDALMVGGAKPDAWHLDIDWRRATREKKSPADFIKAAQTIAATYGIKVGLFLVGYEHTTDAEYAADVQRLATTVKGMGVQVDHVLVQSWAFRVGSGAQDIPLNLGPSGLLASLHQIVSLFPGTATTPPPVLVPPKELTDMIAYAPPVAGFLAGEFEPHPDGGGSVAVRKPNGYVLCVTPDGAVEQRPNDGTPVTAYKPGAWEKFKKGKNALIAERDGGKVFVLPFAEA